MSSRESPIVCLMGPTASGKTAVAVELTQRLPVDIVSVDSAMVYRGMDIGTAKPDAETLSAAPHRLIDIRDPEDAYSAGAFCRDALREIAAIQASGRTPLLVGGTMLYFRALLGGIAILPKADPAIRKALDEEAALRGWPALHADLEAVDPEAAARIKPGDRQRIQRALEVYKTSGRSISDWQATSAHGDTVRAECIALIDPDRARLHTRINCRFDAMVAQGFVDEVRRLRQRAGLSADHASMRAVGYRQLWAYLDGRYSLESAAERARAATRQLAKRQLTWLRGMSKIERFDPLETGVAASISRFLERKLNE